MKRIAGEQQSITQMQNDVKHIAKMVTIKRQSSNLSSADDESESMSLILSVLPFQYITDQKTIFRSFSLQLKNTQTSLPNEISCKWHMGVCSERLVSRFRSVMSILHS
jgi:hypothetical protein